MDGYEKIGYGERDREGWRKKGGHKKEGGERYK